ncbi:MAG TPA: IS21 family transposase [Acidimicrobiales bacterium]|nr:IS21 family transposase [Acidimicrobiales bacterium]
MKSARERMDMIAAYRDVGSFRGAAEICGVDPKTVKLAVLKAQGVPPERAERAHNYEVVVDVVAKRVDKTQGKISAKRLLPEAKAAGYRGSARNFRRLVAKAKNDWRAGHHRGRRPGVWSPGETLIIDWGSQGPLHVFCAVLAWSRYRFVRFATDETAATTLSLLAECFEVLGGVPKVVLADRMGCLKAGVVMNVVVPTPTYVRFATHYGFRPDFCEGGDPESKGMVEHLVGYSKRDLLIPAECSVEDLPGANAEAERWCCEVNGVVHSEICAVPAERLDTERELLRPLPSLRPTIGKVMTRKVDKLSCIRFGSARYSVPISLVGRSVEVHVAAGRLRVVHLGSTMAEHELVAPGETSICDDHYGGPRNVARRAPRPRSDTERAVLALGEAAEAFVKGAAAAGASTLGAELPELLRLEAAHGRHALVGALERAVAFGRWRVGDVRSILEAGAGVIRPAKPGEALIVPLPLVATRPLTAYAPEGLS